MAFGVYVHVPWCRSVCGYCDFNTYVPRADEPASYVHTAVAEIALMPDRRPDTVFIGGGTPTLLDPADVGRLLEALRPVPGAEITIEANPDTVDERKLAALRAAGVTRVSIGMQSSQAHVLRTLERTHTPGAAVAAAGAARRAGFEHVSLDLIYGTPGETDDDWRASLDAALSAEPDHISAYALVVERGTRLSAAVRAGRVPAPDEDALADRYEIADAVLTAAGLHWYEICNWAASEASWCRHNLGYWSGDDWWAIGPGAHGHLAGERFWTHRHPHTHAAAVARGERPIAGRETLTEAQRRLEETMLGLRRRDGLATAGLDAGAVAALRADGLLAPAAPRDVAAVGAADRAVLTLRGRRLADTVIRALA